MKRVKLIALILILLIFYLILFPYSVNADTIVKTDDLYGTIDPENYNPGRLTQNDVGILANKTGTILATIRNIGIITSVVVLSIIGIKYILGSLQDKADYKQEFTIYVVGCFLLMMATTIPSIVYRIMN